MTTASATAANKAVIREAFEAINAGRLLEALDDHPGFWETRQVIPPSRLAFADWRTTVPWRQIAEGDRVFTYGAVGLTHAGPFAGIAPTGRRVTLEGFSLDRVLDGIVIEHNSTTTWPDVLRRIGAPGAPPGPARPAPTGARPLCGPGDAGGGAQARRWAGATRPRRRATSTPAVAGGVRRAAAFPDLAFTLVGQIAEGDLVGTRATLRGTHGGALFGHAPTGRAIAWDQGARVAGGAVVEVRASADWTAAAIQLGLFPRLASLTRARGVRSATYRS